jgi:hypothetical protein
VKGTGSTSQRASGVIGALGSNVVLGSKGAAAAGIVSGSGNKGERGQGQGSGSPSTSGSKGESGPSGPSAASKGPQPSGSTSTPAKSLSRCARNTDGFVPETFKLTPPTPNEPNACKDGVRYTAAQNIEEISEDEEGQEEGELVEGQVCERNSSKGFIKKSSCAPINENNIYLIVNANNGNPRLAQHACIDHPRT